MDLHDIIIQLNNEKDMITCELNEKQRRIEEINITIKNLTDIISKVEVICPKCNGEGKIFKRSCAEDEGDYQICGKCHGEGRISVLK